MKKIVFYLDFPLRWIGEKYDGVRICWNNHTKELYLFALLVAFATMTTIKVFKIWSADQIAIKLLQTISKY